MASSETGVWSGASRDAQLEEIRAEIHEHEIQKDGVNLLRYDPAFFHILCQHFECLDLSHIRELGHV